MAVGNRHHAGDGGHLRAHRLFRRHGGEHLHAVLRDHVRGPLPFRHQFLDAQPRPVRAAAEEEENLLNYLTQREEEVLELLTQGITYKGVANKLFISETTVKTHVNNIFQKLQVNDRTQAVLYAINNGFLTKKVKLAV